jgi:three-Cys-motif partner protein
VSTSRDPWDITERPHTRAKLRLLSDYFNRWLVIWNGARQREWASREWFVLDMFAGQGQYVDGDTTVAGSPLVYLERIAAQSGKLRENNIMIRVLLVEKKLKFYKELVTNINLFLEAHPELEGVATVKHMRGDCNSPDVWAEVSSLSLSSRTPFFALVDPYGFAMKRQTMDRLVDLQGTKDILFNYMVSGVKRAEGIAAKPEVYLSSREKTTLATYVDFLGRDVQLGEDAESPQEYAQAAFVSKGFYVVAYDMDYPDRSGTLYYLLCVTRNKRIADMARTMFGEAKKQDFDGQLNLWSSEQLKTEITFFVPKGSE